MGAFDCRSDSRTSAFGWGGGWCRLTLKSLTSLADGPAKIPHKRGRPSIPTCDSTVDVFVAQKLQVMQWLASTSSSVAAAPPAVSTVVAGELGNPTTRFHAEHRLAILQGFAGIHPSSEPCLLVMDGLVFLRDRMVAGAYLFIQAELAAYLHRTALMALFLGHQAMRVSMNLELAQLLPYDRRKPAHYKMAAAWRQSRPRGSAFDIGVPGRAKGTCGVCRRDVPPGCMLSESPCGHAFHSDCINFWLAGKDHCPLCASLINNSNLNPSMSLSCPKPVPLSS